MASDRIQNHANLIWAIAELLRGDYKQSEYGRVILPFVVMRRLDQVLTDTKDVVLDRARRVEEAGIENIEPPLRAAAGEQFFNRSPLTFNRLLDDPGNIAQHLRRYIDGYSDLARQVIDKFEFDAQIDRLDRSNLLYQVIARICDVDLHPDRVSNLEMGYIFEELIRKFAEQSNETAGEHFTPREVVRLMVNLLLAGRRGRAARAGRRSATVFDPRLRHRRHALRGRGPHPRAEPGRRRFDLFGQELNPESYAICKADMLVKGQDAERHRLRQHALRRRARGERFDYCIANPPFGVDWKKVEKEVRDEHADARLRRPLRRRACRAVSDGQLLFLLHLISKMRGRGAAAPGSRIVLNGSPLFTGGAGSGRVGDPPLVLENDLARGDRRAARAAVLQHRHRHLRLDALEPQGARAPRQGAAHRRP